MPTEVAFFALRVGQLTQCWLVGDPLSEAANFRLVISATVRGNIHRTSRVSESSACDEERAAGHATLPISQVRKSFADRQPNDYTYRGTPKWLPIALDWAVDGQRTPRALAPPVGGILFRRHARFQLLEPVGDDVDSRRRGRLEVRRFRSHRDKDPAVGSDVE